MKDNKAIITPRKPFDKLIAVPDHLRCRTREGPIRTVSQIPMQIKVPCHQTLPIHKVLGTKVRELKVFGLTNREIALRLKINRKTVAKALL